uniref:Myosin light chain kinase 2, skeletal/cardiac muscle-like n=1 Tax=Callorhinchus milii TaxID=7868 RepID=A0A4W3GSU4_CALMI
MDIKIESLSQKIDNLTGAQEKVIQKLNDITQDIDKVGKDIEILKVDKKGTKETNKCDEDANKKKDVFFEITDVLSILDQSSKEHSKKIDGIENIVLGIQQVINFLGETFKNFRFVEFLVKGQTPSNQGSSGGAPKGNHLQKASKKQVVSEKIVKDEKSNNLKGKPYSSTKEKKSQKKKKPPDSAVSSAQKNALILSDKKIQKLNKENVDKSSVLVVQGDVKEAHLLAEQRTPTKLKEKPLEEEDGAFESESSSPTKSIAPDVADTVLEAYSGDENKDECITEEEQSEKDESEESEQTTDEPEKTRIMIENLKQGAKGAEEKMDEVYKELIMEHKAKEESEPSIKEENEPLIKEETEPLIIDENEEAEGKDIQADKSNKVVELDLCEDTGSDVIIMEESKSTVEVLPMEEVPEGQELVGHSKNCIVLLQRYEDSETEAGAFLAAAAEPEVSAEPEAVASDNTELSEARSLGTPSKKRVTDEDLIKDDDKKSRVEENAKSEQRTAQPESNAEIPVDSQEENKKLSDKAEEEENTPVVIDDSPPAPAPFEHRIVSAKPAKISNHYTVHKSDVLGGGRFGQVHKCVEKSTGLTLAAKIIKVRFVKDKEEVKNEIQVMNQLNHTNLIQLYDAFESKNDIILIMEYIEGGELFDRIIDESCNLTELDTILLTRQICEGLVHAPDPENILCVNRVTNQVKIIDFGFARRYKPREKLKIHFGTPEFLSPEVVNYDFVSFPTDMWSLGVITYMLLTGLSPFLGEDDNETLNNILTCSWDFDDEEFDNVSEDAKEFISKLLIKEKGARISAAQCLKQTWLNNIAEKAKQCKVRLKSQILLQKYMVRRQWKKTYHGVTATNRFKKFNNSDASASVEA